MATPPAGRAAVLNDPGSEVHDPQLYSTASYEETAWTRVNEHRDRAGLPLFSLKKLSGPDPALAQAAQNHADYLALNNLEISHAEVEGYAGFSGKTVGDRAETVGYAYQNIGEVISAGQGPQAGVDSLITAIYHRYSLLSPNYTEMGVGNADHPTYGNVMVINPARPQDAPSANGTIARYPAPEQNAVPVIFSSDSEIPDPVATQDLVGYPVSIHFSGDYDIQFTSFTLSQNGSLLETKLLTQTSDEHTPENVFALIPLDILNTYTTYTAHFEAQVNTEPFSTEWSFSTGPFMDTSPGKVGCIVGQSVEVAITGGTGSIKTQWNDDSIIGVQLQQGDTGITMLVTGEKIGQAEITVTDSGHQQIVPVSVLPSQDAIQLEADWNLVSLTRTPEQSNATQLFAGLKDQLTSAWKWDLSSGNGTWAVYLPGEVDQGAAYAAAKGFSTLNALHPREGCWLNMNSQSALQLNGPIPQDEAALVQGWNLIGTRGFATISIDDLLDKHTDRTHSVWTWQHSSGSSGQWAVSLPGESDGGEAYAQSKGFALLTEIQAGEGFWLNAQKGFVLE